MIPSKQQQDIIDNAKDGKSIAIEAIAGSGKEQPVDCIVKTPIGDKRLGDLHVGDYIYGKNGKLTRVTGIFPQGEKDVYEVTFRDGSKTKCGINHNWEVITIAMRDKSKTRTMTLKQILKYGITGSSGQYKLKIPLCDPIDYPEQELPLHPYILGALLGDGCFTTGTPLFSYHIDDKEILDKILFLFETHHNLKVLDRSRSTSELGKQTTLITDSSNGPNPVTEILKKLNLYRKPKHIPDQYLLGSIEQRLGLLHGLMDTDGCCSKNRTSFSTSNKDILQGIVTLVQSLGGTAIVTTPDYRRDNVNYRVNIKMFTNPFSYSGKSNLWSFSSKNPPSRYITSIKLLPKKQQQVCIKVDAEDSLYLTDNFIVTHNTSTLNFIASNVPKNGLYLAFNKSIADEAISRFPGYVTCKTIHSIAWKEIIKYSKSPYGKRLQGNWDFNDINVLNLVFNTEDDLFECKLQIFEALNKYCTSTIKSIDDFVALPYEIDTEGNEIYYSEDIQNEIVRLWRDILDEKGTCKITHNVYLKLFTLTDPVLPYEIIYYDECLPAEQKVKTDIGPISIKKLYNLWEEQKPLPKILSYNIEKSIFEYKDMVGALQSLNREVIKVETEGLNILECTPNHPVLTQRGYVPAGDLLVGTDYILLDSSKNQKSKLRLNKDQLSVVIGSFLGDGSLSKQSSYNTYRLRLVQGMDQREYFIDKSNIFQLDSHYMGVSGYTGVRSIFNANTKTFVLDKPIWNHVIEDMTLQALAIWYMDDGNLSRHGHCTLHSNSFTYEQHLELQKVLATFGYTTVIDKSNKGYYSLRFNVENSRKFLKDISPYMFESMTYKNPYATCDYIWDNQYLPTGANVVSKITNVGTKTVYDIEVADNHNFITTRSNYSVGLIVHNCQDSNAVTAELVFNQYTLYNKQVIIVGDPHQAIYGFNNCINAFNILPEGFIHLPLSESYRYTQEIADIAKSILAINREPPVIIGKEISNGVRYNENQQVYLVRKNTTALETILNSVSQGLRIKCYIDLKDLWNKMFHIEAVLFNKPIKYPSRDLINYTKRAELLTAAKKLDDIKTLLNCYTIVSNGGLWSNKKLIEQYLTDVSEDADVIILTAHKAKGLTFDEVTITDDFVIVDDDEQIEDTKCRYKNDETLFQEINLLYVAATRAKYKVYFPQIIKDIFEL